MHCTHTFIPSNKQDYEVCTDCGTYHSLTAPPPEQIYSKDYWSEKHGHSSIEEQVHNVEVHTENGVSKNQFVIDSIEATGFEALEIGCAPGCLLKRLEADSGFENVIGIEVDAAYSRSIVDNAGDNCDLHFGYFPAITKKWFDDKSFSLIIGLDIFEHSHEPEEFLKECHRLLKPNGQLLLMLPLRTPDESLPERFFDPIEHVFLHTEDNLTLMLADVGFMEIKMDRWTAGHDMVSART